MSVEFVVAISFYASLARLPGADQKLVKLTVFDLQADQAAPGLQVHRVEASRETRFWSVRRDRARRRLRDRAPPVLRRLHARARSAAGLVRAPRLRVH